METILLWSHPVIQSIALCMGIIAMIQGWKRVSFYMGNKSSVFPWKRHVKWGSAALILWIIGATGFYITHTVFGMTHITDIHAILAWFIVGLSCVGLWSGYVMNKNKIRRKWFPIIHGCINVSLLVLVVYEAITGFELMSAFGLIN